MKGELFYIQSKGFCGNCLAFWRENGGGYTCNLDEAWMVTKAKALEICRNRPDQDFPLPADGVDKLAVRHLTQSGLKVLTGGKRSA